MNRRSKDNDSRNAQSNEDLSTEAKAAKLQEILKRVARRESEDLRQGTEEKLHKNHDRREAESENHTELLEKIKNTYEKYIEKKLQKTHPISQRAKQEQMQKDLSKGTVSWQFVTYQDLEKLDLEQESDKTVRFFVANLVMMVTLLFYLLFIIAITAIFYLASEDDVDVAKEIFPRKDASAIFKNNVLRFLALFPTILIVLQVLIHLAVIQLDNLDEVYFYIQGNGQATKVLKGVFGLSIVLLTFTLGFRVQQSEDSTQKDQDQIQLKHICACILSCLHALSMMLLAQSKLKDAENIYMRYLYDKHKHDFPKGTVEHKNVSSSDEAESK